jgi:adenine C2-methylase RlmN of 23S rRNA A2503 and tRNA A37
MYKKILSKELTKWPSINHIIPFKKGYLEARYVRREQNYISAYVSSHNGCNHGCKFCFLTEQKQTSFDHVGIQDYEHQIDKILSNVPSHHNELSSTDIRVNINFMSRGESLSNKNIVKHYPTLYKALYDQVVNTHQYKSLKMNLSTIMPLTVKDYNLIDIFQDKPVNLYYSLYSANETGFKKIWMPNAMPVELALDKLKEFQLKRYIYDPLTIPNIVFHWAFIKGQNDDMSTVQHVANLISERDFIQTKFNLVRLNPHPNATFQETDEIRLQGLFNILNDAVLNNNSTLHQSRIITRVGTDIRASCGTFFSDDEIDQL